jgi:hypothetical protein
VNSTNIPGNFLNFVISDLNLESLQILFLDPNSVNLFNNLLDFIPLPSTTVDISSNFPTTSNTDSVPSTKPNPKTDNSTENSENLLAIIVGSAVGGTLVIFFTILLIFISMRFLRSKKLEYLKRVKVNRHQMDVFTSKKTTLITGNFKIFWKKR